MPKRRRKSFVKAKSKFILALAFISIIGFISNIVQLLFGLNLGAWTVSLTSMILGIGLLIEGGYRNLLKAKRKFTIGNLVHLLTLIVGLTIFIFGIIALPILGVEITGTLKSILIFTNIIALIVILVEVFIVK